MNLVLVFGGSGYIGSTVTKMLLDKDYKVVNLDFKRPNIVFTKHPNYQWINIDLSKPKSNNELTYSTIEDFIGSNNVVGSIHFAAYKDVTESVSNPFKYYNNNLKSLINAIEISKEANSDVFVFSSSASVYNVELVGEVGVEDAGNPVSPYGRTKLIGETILTDLSTQFKLPSLSLRYFNPVGNTEVSIDNSQSLFSAIRNSLETGCTLTVFGTDYPTRDGTCMRDFIDIRDLAASHIHVLENYHSFFYDGSDEIRYHNILNIGTGVGNTVKEVVEAVKKIYPEFKYEYGPRRIGDLPGSYAKVDLLTESGFKCKYSIEDSIKTLKLT